VRVRITEAPQEQEIDGVKLDRMQPGTVRDVSPTVGSWLIVNGYAYPEMRRATNEDQQSDDYSTGSSTDEDRPRYLGPDRRKT
jgi:hypothetical protein